MPKNLTPTQQEEILSNELSTRMLVTIYPPGIEPFRFVANDNMDLTMPDGTVYLAAAITRGDISTTIEGDKEQVALKLSNRYQAWAEYAANSGVSLKGATCVIEDVFINHLDQGAVWRFKGILDKFRLTISEMNCVVIRDAISFDEEAPHMDYGPTCQFVFGDSRCRATGDPCDQTMPSCDAKGNVTRFQGHPSVAREMVIRGW